MHNFPHRLPVLLLVAIALILASLACNVILPESDEETSPSGKPDLVVSTGQAGMELTGACLEEYGPITTRICAENRGNASSSSFLLTVNDGTSWTIAGLGPSEAICFDIDSNLSGAVVTTDVNKEIDESNEDNNTWTIPAPTPPTLCTQEVEEIQPTAEPDVTYQGVNFSYDDTFASSVTPETVAAQEDAAVEAWNTPEHIQFMFNGYPLPDSFHTPRILVFPVDAYNAINPTAGDTIYQLQQLLENKPSDPEKIPFLPVFNAGQFMQAQVGYFRFQNGAGVRFLTQYGQAVWPINSDDMFYTFQGITDDGMYYISAILPISHPNLPDPESITMDDAFYDHFMDYVADVEDRLNAEPSESFTPSLLKLDAMMGTLFVVGMN
ncbi:MAG: hypothetical protein A2Z14_17375 [Chloroflexi bacterium RBG_16_48_8]|nr:MAG: hypothetical protein A2Z14_17375 [Chloroflexi bacterium RBG_16_48_8]